MDSKKKLDRAHKALQTFRQYQQAWLEHGCDRIYLYYDNPSEALDIIVDGLTAEDTPIEGTIKSFIQTEDTVTIELDDGRTITISAYSHDSYDDEWGKYVPTGYLNVKVE